MTARVWRRDIAPESAFSSMRERVEELGGSCTIEARPSGGTVVTAVLPLGGL